MPNGDGNDPRDGFDWENWGDPPAARAGGTPPSAEEDGPPASEGQWITRGGVLHWEEPDDADPDRVDLRREAGSRWALDDIELPLGAPARPRIRAMRAWLARRRLLEQDAQGAVLLERRQLQGNGDAEEERRRPLPEEGPLDSALAEYQAAATEYERILEALSEFESHSGLERVLVELYLWLTERVAELAAAPEAPDDFQPGVLLAQIERPVPARRPTVLAREEWSGRAGAVLAARRHVERVSAPETDE